MRLEIRRANVKDAAAVARIKHIVWGDKISPDAISCAIQEDNHYTHVATASGKVIGFVDGFITLSRDGAYRWELDLLAVHPKYRGQGIGRLLIQNNTEAGQRMGSEFARSLVEINNTGSQKAFQSVAYVLKPEPHQLLVTKGQENATSSPSRQAYLLPVNTLNYRGIWLEGEITIQSIVAVRAICASYRWDVVGAVVPESDISTIRLLLDTEFQLVSTYQWWRFNYK